jgi:hypothetical protein
MRYRMASVMWQLQIICLVIKQTGKSVGNEQKMLKLRRLHKSNWNYIYEQTIIEGKYNISKAG